METLFILGAMGVGLVLGWIARTGWTYGPEGWIVIYSSLENAASAWRPGMHGLRYLTPWGSRGLTLSEVNTALAHRLRADRRA